MSFGLGTTFGMAGSSRLIILASYVTVPIRADVA